MLSIKWFLVLFLLESIIDSYGFIYKRSIAYRMIKVNALGTLDRSRRMDQCGILQFHLSWGLFGKKLSGDEVNINSVFLQNLSIFITIINGRQFDIVFRNNNSIVYQQRDNECSCKNRNIVGEMETDEMLRGANNQRMHCIT